MKLLPKILTSFLVIGIVSSSALLFSNAFFSDTETSTDNLLQAGELDLLIDNTSYYNGQLNDDTSWKLDNLDGDPGHLFFNFNDIKPGDWGEDTISLHVQNDAWACLQMTITRNDDVTCTEPELAPLNDPSCNDPDEDLFDGELGKQVQIMFWADDGDNVLETDEYPNRVFKKGNLNSTMTGEVFRLTDSSGSIWPTPGPIPGGFTLYIGKAWCHGQIGTVPVPAGQGVNPTIASGITCDGAPLNNASQTDIFTADIQFTAVQARNNPGFLCNPSVTPSPTPPPGIACHEGYATIVNSSDQGLRKNGSAVTADRSDPNYALGAPQSAGTPYDNPVIANSFFSLGFPLEGNTSSIVLNFGTPVINQPGNDLKLWEVTGGTSYPDEKVKVEVANNLAGPWILVSSGATRDADLDLPVPVVSFRYLKITDVSDINLFEDTADGYDLDAVWAKCIKN